MSKAKFHSLHLFFFAGFMLLLLVVPGLATTFTVNSTLDNEADGCSAGVCTLREAISDAQANPGADVIDIAVTGTVTLQSTLPTITQSLTINGPGANVLAVSGNNANRVFRIAAGGNVSISGLKITGGRVTIADAVGAPYQPGGAGLLVENGATVTLSNVIVNANSSIEANESYLGVPGGGIYNAGTLTINSSTVSNNTALGGNLNYHPFAPPGGDARGAGIFNSGTLDIINSTVNGNVAQGGKGAHNPALTPGYPSAGGNGGNGQGGGIFNEGALTLSNSTVSGNEGYGGIGGDGADCAIFTANNGGAGGGGGNGIGGIFNQGSFTLSNSTVSSNSGFGRVGGFGGCSDNGVGGKGGNGGNGVGGILSSGSTFDSTSSTIAFNSATAGQGGIGGIGTPNGATGLPGSAVGGIDLATAAFRSSIVAGNTGVTIADLRGAVTSQGYNLIGKVDGATGFTQPTELTGTNASPLNPQLDPLGDYGGATFTHRLKSNSPAIDKGKNFAQDSNGTPILADQRG
ncbi:MAG: CSLREA domain-containing protein, partial [Acidobacteriota bacterium]|nr:CSLREA domain-containing protein [Acidobacteriota bacterium]